MDRIRDFRSGTTAVHAISLLLCSALCLLGLELRHRAARESRRREEAERELDRERRALEMHVQERTRELSQEVEERRHAEELNRGQKQVLEMLTAPEGHTTEEILRRLTATLAAQNRSWECSLHLADQPAKTLELAASSQVSEKLRRYLASICASFPDAPESQAWASGQTSVVDKMDGVHRPWSELLVANGIFAAWSIPFHTGGAGNAAGTLTVYSRLRRGPSRRDLELTETAAKLAALVLDHRRIHSELMRNAYQDALTGLPNRRAGEQALQAAVEKAGQSGERLSVYWIDLDRFKRINDQYGHGAGDTVLCTVADRLRSHPLVNGIVARMGGDEFLVLVTDEPDPGEGECLCQQLNRAISAPISIGSASVSVSASVGVCHYPMDGTSIDSLERNADFAMYRAKATGGGVCVYSPAMSEEARETLEVEEALGVALEQNYLRLAYQPVYARDGQLTAFEALLRFRHPRLGEISPARFIPIAEETGLIVPIGNWVLREACSQLRAWLEAGLPPVDVAVNISALQIARSDFAETVAAILNECALSPARLFLELTETAVMEDYSAAIGQMNLLKEFGVRIAMDDFGTGYSSLSYIHRFPLDVLKIDRSFIERLTDPDGTRPIVEAVISMANCLGLYVVAEGVETREQQRILEEAGCHGLQGYLFARPLTPQEAGDCLAAMSSAPFASVRQIPGLASMSAA